VGSSYAEIAVALAVALARPVVSAPPAPASSPPDVAWAVSAPPPPASRCGVGARCRCCVHFLLSELLLLPLPFYVLLPCCTTSLLWLCCSSSPWPSPVVVLQVVSLRVRVGGCMCDFFSEQAKLPLSQQHSNARRAPSGCPKACSWIVRCTRDARSLRCCWRDAAPGASHDPSS
jgi:hypothetical protein